MPWYKQLKTSQMTSPPGQKLGIFLMEALKGPVDPNILHTSLDAFITDEGMLNQIISQGMQYVAQITGVNNQLNENQQAVINEIKSKFGNGPSQQLGNTDSGEALI